jgi:hypothetical protein
LRLDMFTFRGFGRVLLKTPGCGPHPVSMINF